MMNAASKALFHFQEFGANVANGDHRFARFFDLTNRPAQRVRNERERFDQADMPHFPLAEQLAKITWRQAAAELSLKRQPTLRRIDDPLDFNAPDVATDACQAERQCVHYEAGIHARSKHTRVMLSAECVELVGERGFFELRKDQF